MHSMQLRKPAATPLRHTLSTLISFFAESYKSTFGFELGPPLHDALTIAYVSNPELFKSTRYRVDVELTGTHTAGETVVDVWNYKRCDNSWGRYGKNCLVAEALKVSHSLLFFLSVLRMPFASPGPLPPIESSALELMSTQNSQQVPAFFELLFDAIGRCDKISPLNAVKADNMREDA